MQICKQPVRLSDIPFLLVLFLLLPAVITSETPGSDADALLNFKDTLQNVSVLTSWETSTTPCDGDISNWVGVLCFGGTVSGIKLENLGFKGNLNVDPLVNLHYLRSISFMNNDFEGSMPMVKNLKSLISVYLSNNRLSGEIPDDAFEGLENLNKVLLANNAFRGKIPSSLAKLQMLQDVRVNGNQFEGQIPDFNQSGLKLARFENNNLEGPIPEALIKMDSGSFAGNGGLCGPPLPPCTSSQPGPQETKKHGSLLTIAIILITLASILLIIALVIIFTQCRKPNSASDWESRGTSPDYSYEEYSNPSSETKRSPAHQGRFMFVRQDVPEFDLKELLIAPAEVLGSGNFGGSYKAVVTNGQALVVKRYLQMGCVGRGEFHEHMRRLGKLSHQNVLPLVAYYYTRDKKLLVTNFMRNSSLASHLHAKHSVNQPGLDWETRLKIVKGVARGLSYLHTKLRALTIPHAHLKSSNVVLDDSFQPLLTDYGLRPVTDPEHAHKIMIAYKSPEYTNFGSTSRKTDVWCLGILILEILTGKIPEDHLNQRYDSDRSLATWVRKMVSEKKTGEVFDKEMPRKKNSKGEMIGLLKIGLSCCEENQEMRLEMKEAEEMIEGLRSGEFEQEFSSGATQLSEFSLDNEISF